MSKTIFIIPRWSDGRCQRPERKDTPMKRTKLVNIADALENPNSTFQQIQSQRIASATNWLTSGDGYVVARKGTNGEWKELLFMDTDDESTAQKGIRINENGIGFSDFRRQA